MLSSSLKVSAALFVLAITGCTKHAPQETTANVPAKSTRELFSATHLSKEQQAQAGVRFARVEKITVPQMLSVTGKVSMDESRTAHIGSLADGIVEKVLVLPGDKVRAGQVLAHVHSHLIHETAAALSQAFADTEQKKSALQYAEQAHQRYEHLYSIQAASLEEEQKAEQQLIQARKDVRVAEANVRQEREHLGELLQIRPDSISQDNVFSFEDVPIRTPINGFVVTRNITPATVVQAGTEAFLVTDLSTIWVTGAVNEKDIASLRIGGPAEIKVQGYGEQIFRGRVGQIGTTLDPATRTIPVRIVVPNPNNLLRPEMFANATIEGHLMRPALIIPEDAMQDTKGVPTVFVRSGSDEFRAQAVSPGNRTQASVEILQGLEEGDEVVTSGAFMVKSSLLKGSLEAK